VIERRRFIELIAGGLLAVPLAAEGQQAGKVYRVGVLTLVSVPALEEVFRQSLKERGYVEGQNIALEWRWAEGKTDRLVDLAADLVGQRMEVIVTASNAAADAAKAATATIPIVMAAVGNPEQRGLVASLSKPGGNVTGLTLDPGAEIAGKMLELLKEAAPKIVRVAML
jgi:putative ABC transport system substrate-binding protein